MVLTAQSVSRSQSFCLAQIACRSFGTPANSSLPLVFFVKGVAQKKKVSNLLLKFKNGTEKQHELIYHQPYLLDKMNTLAISRYTLKPLDIKIDVFRVENQNYYMHDPIHLGWKDFARKGVQVHNIPGDHNYLFSPPNDKVSAQILQTVLDKYENI